MRRLMLFLIAFMMIAPAARAQWDKPTPAIGAPDTPRWPPGEHFTLWPGKPPGAPAATIEPNWTMNGPKGERQLWIRGVPFPRVHVFRPARPNGSAMLVIPGGGYGFLSVQNEGSNAARRFTTDGITVFVLEYRLPGEGWANRNLVPLQDTQRAMRLIRARAKAFKIDPEKLGVLGFSAGAHLAADLAVSHAERTYSPVDAADALSAKPAYVGLVYPVATLVDPGGTSQSADRLLGPSPTRALLESRSPLLHVTKGTPPSFLVHAMDDPQVPHTNTSRWVGAASKAGAVVESHVFPEGGHGFGLSLPRDLPASRWPDLFTLFLRKHGG